jgi:hypothetical protein
MVDHGALYRDARTRCVAVVREHLDAGPAIDRYLCGHPDAPLAGPAVLDTVSHEHDIRGALGVAGGRDAPAIEPMVVRVLRFLSPPSPLVVRLVDAERADHAEIRVGPADDDREPQNLTTTCFEALRWRFGRRSPRQLAAMDWSADPTAFLPHLCVFGPRDTDLVE